MPRPSGKATISLKGNAKNLPDVYFRELVQLYSRDCRIRGIEEVTIAGYEYACKKFLEYLQEDIRCSDLCQELFDDYQMELATRVKAETVNSYLFKISPVLKFGKERGYITADIQLSHMAYQEHFKDVYTEEEIRKLLVRPKTNKFNEYRTWVIVSVFLGTGIRSLELRSIRCKDVNLNEGYIISKCSTASGRMTGCSLSLRAISTGKWSGARKRLGSSASESTTSGTARYRF